MQGSTDLNVCQRPGYGSAGKKVQVITNHYRLKAIPQLTVYQYNIQIKCTLVPPSSGGSVELSSEAKVRIWNTKEMKMELGENYQTFIYDGQTLAWSKILVRNIPIITIKSRDRAVTVEISQTTKFDLGSVTRYIRSKQCFSKAVEGYSFLNHLIRAGPAGSFVTRNKAYITRGPRDVHAVDGIIEFRHCFFQTIRWGGKFDLTINVDTTPCIFWDATANIAALVQKLLNVQHPSKLRHPFTDEQLVRLKQLRQLKFFVRYSGAKPANTKMHSLDAISSFTACTKMFSITRDSGDIEQISVKEYVLKNYNLKLKYPDMPLIESKRGCFPMEVCYICPAQRYNGEISASSFPKWTQYSIQRPSERQKNIQAKVDELAWDRDKFLNAFGVQVYKFPVVANARILPAPTLQLDKICVPKEGKWNHEPFKFYEPQELKSWGILVCSPRRKLQREHLTKFFDMLIETAQSKGMRIVNRPLEAYASPETATSVAKELYHKVGNHFREIPQIILVVLPSKSHNSYLPIKHVYDTGEGLKWGVQSQMLWDRHVIRPSRLYCANLCMKLNTKVGGVVVAPSRDSFPLLRDNRTMLLGADVSHNTGPEGLKPSLATVVGSIDKYATRYVAAACNQTARQEIIQNLASMIEFCVREFVKCHEVYEKRRTLPERIIYYRDGVSEGQFEKVLREELPAIRKGIQNLKPPIEQFTKIKITVCIVRKRHHTILFPKTKEDGDGNGNCLPGTVVDSGITHPHDWDWFMIPHSAARGTARPAHYYVLHDENKFSSDELQQFSNNLSYIYCRSSHSVSLIPPVYYAHLVSKRARSLDSAFFGEEKEATQGDKESVPPLDEIATSLKARMWWV